MSEGEFMFSLWGDGLHKCRKPDCLRLVSAASAYCCPSCSTADEGGYEIEPHDPAQHPILTHSAECDVRSRERGEAIP